MPKISVIVPVYNVEQYLVKCLDSIVNQTFQDIEIICINDGSTDNSGKILEEYAQKDERFKIINQENKGLSVARNEGLLCATGEYISFIDGDDFIHSRFIEVLYQVIIQNECDIAGCDFRKVYRDEKPSFRNSKPKKYVSPLNVLLNKKNFIHFNVWNKLYKRDAIKDVSFVENLYFEDWVFNLCVFAQNSSFVWVKDKMYGYRISSNSIMRSQFSEKKQQDYVKGIKIVAEYFQTNYPNDWERVKRLRISRTVKMLMNSTLRSKSVSLYKKTQEHLRELYQQKLIGYAGLSCVNKFKLFKFLHLGE